jgi:hypothetical protein
MRSVGFLDAMSAPAAIVPPYTNDQLKRYCGCDSA